MQATVLNTIRNKPTNNLKIDCLSMRKQKSKKWTNLISVTKLVSEENVTWSHVFCTPIFKWRICSSALASCSTTPLTPNPYPHLRKSNSRILVDTNLIPWRLISDLPDAISQYAEYPHIHWRGMGGGRSSESKYLVSIKSQRREWGNLTASHTQTVNFEEFYTPCSPVMSRIFVPAIYSLPWTVWDKHWWSFCLFPKSSFFEFQTTQGRRILFYLHYL